MKNNKVNKNKNEKERIGEEDLPGYRPYPPAEDITSQSREEHLDEQGNRIVPEGEPTEPGQEDDSIIKGESQLTEDDLQALGPADDSLRMDMSDDEELKQRHTPRDFSDDELDIPGAELDDDQENVGSEDEENNYYSLGGDRHENLEEPKE